jgi:hypothetical protein
MTRTITDIRLFRVDVPRADPLDDCWRGLG